MLTEKELIHIKKLQDLCEEHEQISLKLNWEMLKNRNEKIKEDFFHYENEKLVGYVANYYFGEKVEICGMVHPNYRRNGIFSKLLNEALSTIAKDAKILLNAPDGSKSAKEFVKGEKFVYSFSEYQMVWKNNEIQPFEPIINFTKANLEDFTFISNLDVICFGFEKVDADKYNERIINEPDRILSIIEVNNEKIGKMSLKRENNESWIYGFAIHPKFQGKGYGKNALLQVIEQENNIGNEIHLEVALENDHAKKLYLDCGFKQYYTQDYYLIKRNG